MALGNEAATIRSYFRRNRELAAMIARNALTWASARQDGEFR